MPFGRWCSVSPICISRSAWSGLGSSRAVDRLLQDPVLEGRVFHLGHVQVPELLAVTDVLALPYRLTIGQAAFPATLMEAMAAQVPIVTTDLPLLRELTGDGRTAILVPPDDPGALAGGIECILTQPALAAQMRQSQRRWVQQAEPQQVVKEYERLYGQVTAQQASVLRPTGDRERLP